MRREFFVAAFLCLALPALATAEEIKIGLIKIAASAPIYIAQEKGYFAAEGLTAEIVPFDSGQPITIGVVTGDLDFGCEAMTVGFYNLASQGALKIIAALAREMPGFQGQGYLASNRAFAAGLTAPQDLAGHSVAISQFGGPAQYALGRLAEKYHFDPAGMRLLPLQSLSNAMTAVVGGQADATVISMTAIIPPMLERGDAKLLGWVGDETPWQYGVTFTATKTADGKRPTVERFLRAYIRGVRDYHDAFTGPDETRKDGPAAPEMLAILAKYMGQTAAQVALSVSYTDRNARIDVADILHQIEWYRTQGLLKVPVDGTALIDQRYAVALPR
jgi:NitT/TauT family transport system substrate-binding protein